MKDGVFQLIIPDIVTKEPETETVPYVVIRCEVQTSIITPNDEDRSPLRGLGNTCLFGNVYQGNNLRGV